MRGTKKIRVALLATTLLGGLLVAVQPAVAEPSSTISLKPINTKCTDKKDLIKWVGGQETYAHTAAKDTRPRGGMYLCWSVYKVREDRKRFDWWVAYLETRWYNASSDLHWKTDAYMSQQITSSQWAVDNTESATGSFTSNKECGTPFTISAGFYGASVSTTQQLCDEYTVRRGHYDANGAIWDTAKVGMVDRIETVYMQKVRAGSGRPTFKFFVEIPRYTYEHNGAAWLRTAKYKWVGRKI
jgi:hypothetical protein